MKILKIERFALKKKKVLLLELDQAVVRSSNLF